MHRDLKAESTQPSSTNLAAQQRRFERWRYTYNHERPHEALARKRPAEVYQPSSRRLRENDKPIVYGRAFEVKQISASGHLAHEGKHYHVGEAFAGKRVGLRQADDGQIELHFANVHLGNLRFDADGGRFKPTAYVAPVRQSHQAGRLSVSPSAPPLKSDKGGSQAPSLEPSPDI